MTALALMAVLALCYAWHRIRCGRCTVRRRVDRAALADAIEVVRRVARFR